MQQKHTKHIQHQTYLYMIITPGLPFLHKNTAAYIHNIMSLDMTSSHSAQLYIYCSTTQLATLGLTASDRVATARYNVCRTFSLQILIFTMHKSLTNVRVIFCCIKHFYCLPGNLVTH